jgi:hypothetical protein
MCTTTECRTGMLTHRRLKDRRPKSSRRTTFHKSSCVLSNSCFELLDLAILVLCDQETGLGNYAFDAGWGLGREAWCLEWVWCWQVEG